MRYKGILRSTSQRTVTELLLAWSHGEKSALDELMPMVQEELRRLANRRLGRERVNHTLQATALVNEAFLKLVDQNRVRWQNRAHFFAVAAEMMRRVLVDYARRRQYAKRGGGAVHVALDDAGWGEPADAGSRRATDVVRLDDALTSLASLDPRKAKMVELRFFGGLSIEETAEVLGVSPGTVMRDWTLAKAWLQREVSRQ
jgi:RNA polymerase sigma-70 factor, ECF subfamily